VDGYSIINERDETTYIDDINQNIMDEYGTEAVIALTEEEHNTDMTWFIRKVAADKDLEYPMVALYQRCRRPQDNQAAFMAFLPDNWVELFGLQLTINNRMDALDEERNAQR
jgi:hypothetical protein